METTDRLIEDAFKEVAKMDKDNTRNNKGKLKELIEKRKELKKDVKRLKQELLDAKNDSDKLLDAIAKLETQKASQETISRLRKAQKEKQMVIAKTNRMLREAKNKVTANLKETKKIKREQ